MPGTTEPQFGKKLPPDWGLAMRPTMKKHISYFFGVLTLLASACKDQPEAIPAYLKLEPFIVNADGGAAWQKITDGWLYVDGEFLGAYTLPATVPVLADGQSEVWVLPGVKKSGIRTSPDIYSFLTRFEKDYTLTPGQTTAVQPITAYDPNTKEVWDPTQSNFEENAAVPLENRDSDAATGFKVTTDGAFSGKSVLLEVDTAHSVMEIVTEAVPLPNAGAQQTWLELNYRNDIPFQLVLAGTTSTSTQEFYNNVYYFNESPEWNKIYFNLTEFVVAMQQDKYRLYFRVALPKDGNGKFTKEKGAVRLDNIRLLHF